MSTIMARIGVIYVAAGLFVAQANAASLVVTHEPTVTRPGTLTVFALEIEPGESFRGVDANFKAALDSRFNQVYTSRGTPFENWNLFIGDLSLDTQFKFASSDVLSIGVEESETSLEGAISGIARLGITETVIPFAQISDPRVAEFTYDLAFDVGGGPDPVEFSGRIVLVPEPISELLAAIAGLGYACTRRRA